MMYIFWNSRFSFHIVPSDVRQVHSNVERTMRSAIYRHNNETYLKSKIYAFDFRNNLIFAFIVLFANNYNVKQKKKYFMKLVM